MASILEIRLLTSVATKNTAPQPTLIAPLCFFVAIQLRALDSSRESPDFFQEFFYCYWLSQHRSIHRADKFLKSLLVGQPRHENETLRQRGLRPLDRGKEKIAIQLRHLKVTNDDVGVMRKNVFQRRHWMVEDGRLETVQLENLLEKPRQLRVVVHDDDVSPANCCLRLIHVRAG